jgi:hypothetical protein
MDRHGEIGWSQYAVAHPAAVIWVSRQPRIEMRNDSVEDLEPEAFLSAWMSVDPTDSKTLWRGSCSRYIFLCSLTPHSLHGRYAPSNIALSNSWLRSGARSRLATVLSR